MAKKSQRQIQYQHEKDRAQFIKGLSDLMEEVEKVKAESLRAYGSHQTAFDDVFTEYMEAKKVLRPPYSFDQMCELVESSPILPPCIEAYKQNIDGFGHEINPKEGVDEGQITKEMEEQKQRALEFFNNPNGIESFQTIRRNLRDDIERLGNGVIEVIKDISNTPIMAFWGDMRRVRLMPYIKEDYVDYQKTLIRNGKPTVITAKRWFRRFCQITHNKSDDKVSYRYFKEYGDPRIIDAETGAIRSSVAGITPANEYIHFKIGTGSYGVPRWVGSLMRALGLRSADYVNYDLFENQGIPPMVLTLAGGYLSKDSYNDFLRFMKANLTGAKNFNKWLFLEAQSVFPDIMPDGKVTIQRPELKVEDLSKIRQDDAMFVKYIEMAVKSIRTLGFRLPGLYVGESDEYNYATARIARETAERQIFVPLRNDFDEKINYSIMPDLGITDYEFKTLGPSMVDSEQVSAILGTLINGGAFTTNELINQVNKIFNIKLSPYDEDWANIPIPLLLSMGPDTDTFAGNGLTKEAYSKAVATNMTLYRSIARIESMVRDAVDIRSATDNTNVL